MVSHEFKVAHQQKEWARTMKIRTIVLGLLFAGSTAVAEMKTAARPNIVVVLCDDFGHEDLDCYGHTR